MAWTKEKALTKIREVGLIPIVRAPSAEDAMRAAEAIVAGGIGIAEITMTVPGALKVMEAVAERYGDKVLLGAGTSVMAVLLPEPLHARAMVRLAGTFPNVNRMFVPLLTGKLPTTPPTELWAAVLKAVAPDSTMTKDARLSETVRFVKMVAVPTLSTALFATTGSEVGELLAPMARPVAPAPKAVMTFGTSVGDK